MRVIIAAVRTAIIYIMIVAALRFTGKRQLGELQPAELVVALLIADLAAVPMQDNGTPLLYGLVPIAVLVSLEVIASALMLRSSRFARFVSGRPNVVVRDGKIVQAELRRLRMTADDLTETLRGQSVFDLADVRYALVETNGSVSVCLASEDGETPVPVVSDGEFVEWGLAVCGLTRDGVVKQLERRQCPLKCVLLMTVDKQHRIHLVRREGTR